MLITLVKIVNKKTLILGTRLISQNLFNSKFSSISLRKQKNDPSRARRKNHKGSKIDCDNFNKEFKWDKLNIIDVCENKEKFRVSAVNSKGWY